MAKFSDRLGITTPKTAIQIGAIDDDLRNALWNALYLVAFYELRGFRDASNSWQFGMMQLLHVRYFKLAIDEMADDWQRLIESEKRWFYQAPWHEVYNYLEFWAQNLDDANQRNRFVKAVNSALERERAGYRIIGNEVAPITDEQELASIEQALEATSKLGGVRSHLADALAKLADRKAPDYRNSIKESISAVESLCRIIVQKDKASLGDALQLLTAKGLRLHPALVRGWSSLYGYTSNEDGIRHAMLDDPQISFADAKYMLVSCSAFTLYLIALSAEASVPLS
jgi:hypothetical protein